MHPSAWLLYKHQQKRVPVLQTKKRISFLQEKALVNLASSFFMRNVPLRARRTSRADDGCGDKGILAGELPELACSTVYI